MLTRCTWQRSTELQSAVMLCFQLEPYDEPYDKASLNSVPFGDKEKEQFLKIKDAFPKLSSKEIHNVAFNDKQQAKPRINMTTKGPSRKQVIMPMRMPRPWVKMQMFIYSKHQ